MQDLEYLKVNYESIILEKDDLIKTLNLASKIAHTSSSAIECNSITFIPNWNNRTLTLTVTNDLTYFKCKTELLGNGNCLTDIFSIKVDTLNKLKTFFRDKILIYKKEGEFYIRLLDGDLLVDAKVPNTSKLAFTTVPNKLIFEAKIKSFTELLNSYKIMSDDFSDKWLSFDGEKLSLCGLNFYSETRFRSPLMCLLMQDVDLLIKLNQYYSEDVIQIFSTDSKIPKLYLKVGNIEIEILNVLSNINKTNIEKLSQFISVSSYSIETEALRRVLAIAISLSNIDKDCILRVKDNSILVILKTSKGDSEFNLVTQKLERKFRFKRSQTKCKYFE